MRPGCEPTRADQQLNVAQDGLSRCLDIGAGHGKSVIVQQNIPNAQLDGQKADLWSTLQDLVRGIGLSTIQPSNSAARPSTLTLSRVSPPPAAVMRHLEQIRLDHDPHR